MDDRPAPRRPLVAVVAIAVPIVLVAVAILPFLTPAWVAFEQGRADAAGWTRFADADLRRATDSILHDLVVGPPAFTVAVDGARVLDDREIQHMRDVRAVFAGFYVLAACAAVVLLAVGVTARARSSLWRGMEIGGIGTAVAMVATGVFAAVAFDAAFELFHRAFFPAGSYLFDPRTERLVQLFPERFWSETSMALGATILALGLATAWYARRRRRRGTPALASRVRVETAR